MVHSIEFKSLSDDSVELADGLVSQELVEQYLEIRGGDHGQVLGEHNTALSLASTKNIFCKHYNS